MGKAQSVDTGNRKIILKAVATGTLVAVIVGAFSYLFVESVRENEIGTAKEVVTAVWVEDYQSSLKHHATLAHFILAELTADEEIMEAFAALSAADPNHRDEHRQRLLDLTTPFYERITSRGLKQLHFHSPESVSLLRMHKPEKFGDSLQGVRKTVDLANREQRSVSAFEEGRIFNGYRYVQPISWKGRHIGTVETSFSMDAVLQFIKDLNPERSYLVTFRKERIEDTVSEAMQSNYVPFSLHDDFVVDRNNWASGASLTSGFAPEDQPVIHEKLRATVADMCASFESSSGEQCNPIRTIEQDGNFFVLYHEHIQDLENNDAGIIWGFGPAKDIDSIVSQNRRLRQSSVGVSLLFGGLTGLGFFLWSARNQRDQLTTARLNEARFRAKAIFDNSESPQWVIDPEDGSFVDVNRAACKRYGYSKKSFENLRIADIDQAGESELTREIRCLESNQGNCFETRHRIATGEIRDVEVHATLIEVDQKVMIYSIIHDVTERKEAEQQLQTANNELRKQTELANEMVLMAQDAILDKSAFLATMSHEIRTPLNSIVGLAALLEESDLSPSQKDYAQTIVSSSDGLLTLINDILDYSKIEAEKFEMEYSPFEIVDTACSALEILSVHASKKSLPLTYRIDPKTPSIVVGDSVRIRQVILNLLSNAIKFTDRGEVSLSVESERTSENRWKISFAVADTGIGMDQDTLSSLFKPFTQANASTTRKFGGTGLGLSISQRIVNQLDSRIQVESQPGQGSRFYFDLEFETPDESVTVFQNPTAATLTGKRALLIEPNENDRSLIHSLLAEWKVTTEIYPDPANAFTDNSPETYDFVILEAQWLEESSSELLSRNRERGSFWICLEPRGTRNKWPEAEAAPDATISKPIRPERLAETLASLIGSNEGNDEDSAGEEDPKTRSFDVLVADDNRVNQKVIRTILQRSGHAVTCVDDGQAAVEKALGGRYDIILMDLQMPVMDGLTAASKIKEAEGDTAPVIVAFTANSMSEERDRCKQAGMDDFLSKPVRPNDINECFERNLRNRKARKETAARD